MKWLLFIPMMFLLLIPAPVRSGMVIGSGASVTDTAPPTVTAFTTGTPSTQTVPITTFTANDDVAVTGYIITETATTPTLTARGWRSTPPSSYQTLMGGSATLYARARDASGKVSSALTSEVTTTAIAPFTVSDSFSVAGPLTAQQGWTPISGYTTPASGGTTAYVTSGVSGVYYSGATFANNQSVRGSIGGGTEPTSPYGGLAVRISPYSAEYYLLAAYSYYSYDLETDIGGLIAYKCRQGSCTEVINDSGPGIVPSTYELVATGTNPTTLTIKDGGATVATYVDNDPLLGGYPGFVLAGTNNVIDDWSASSL